MDETEYGNAGKMICCLGIYIFDLCGTLTLGHATKRAHLIPPKELRQTPGAWDAYSLAGANELPNAPMITLMRELRKAGNLVYILTGRGEVARKETVEWLRRHGVDYDLLIMRAVDDMRPDQEYKVSVLKDQLDIERIRMCFDDTPEVIKALRDIGLCVMQVTDHRLIPED